MAARVMIDDDHFRKFARSLKRVIASYEEPESDESAMEKQKRQVESLVAAEASFRDALANDLLGVAVFERFVKFIVEEKKNILAARPYFRERQDIFTKEVSNVLRDRDYAKLAKFRFNYTFVLFAMRNGANDVPTCRELAQKIGDIRQEIILTNLPLAISRSHIFWSRTPRAHLSYMDLIQIATEGLASAIDKFVLPYTPVFRSVAIGRMHGNFIEQYSETLIHFFPSERRKIYRANKAIGRLGGINNVDFEVLAEIVNDGVEEEHKTTPAEIADLLAAASCVSADAFSTGDDGDSPSSGLDSVGPAADDSLRPDVRYETAEVNSALGTAITTLTMFERKLLRLKGITL